MGDPLQELGHQDRAGVRRGVRVRTERRRPVPGRGGSRELSRAEHGGAEPQGRVIAGDAGHGLVGLDGTAVGEQPDRCGSRSPRGGRRGDQETVEPGPGRRPGLVGNTEQAANLVRGVITGTQPDRLGSGQPVEKGQLGGRREITVAVGGRHENCRPAGVEPVEVGRGATRPRPGQHPGHVAESPVVVDDPAELRTAATGFLLQRRHQVECRLVSGVRVVEGHPEVHPAAQRGDRPDAGVGGRGQQGDAAAVGQAGDADPVPDDGDVLARPRDHVRDVRDVQRTGDVHGAAGAVEAAGRVGDGGITALHQQIDLGLHAGVLESPGRGDHDEGMRAASGRHPGDRGQGRAVRGPDRDLIRRRGTRRRHGRRGGDQRSARRPGSLGGGRRGRERGGRCRRGAGPHLRRHGNQTRGRRLMPAIEGDGHGAEKEAQHQRRRQQRDGRAELPGRRSVVGAPVPRRHSQGLPSVIPTPDGPWSIRLRPICASIGDGADGAFRPVRSRDVGIPPGHQSARLRADPRAQYQEL